MAQEVLDDNGNPVEVLDDNGNPIVAKAPEAPKPSGKWVTKGSYTEWQADKPVDISKRPDANTIGGIPGVFDKLRETGVNRVAANSWIPEWLKPYAAMGTSLSLEPARFIAETLSTPEGVVFPSAVKRIDAPALFRKTPKVEILPPEIPPVRAALPPGRDRFIGGVDGRVQREVLLNPQEEARLAGYDYTPEGFPAGKPTEPAPRWTNLDEVREQERIKNLDYTSHEQGGGTFLEIPNRPNMDLPPTAGDRRLGFGSVSSGNLPYPLNVVPEAVRPRGAQTVTRALVGDDFAAPIKQSEPVTFESPAPVPDPVVAPKENLLGGTAAIREGETILPSAVKQSKANTGLNTEKVDTIIKDPTIPKEVKAATANFVKEAGQPSILLKSVYTQLSELGDAGKELVRKFQRAAQTRSEYDAVWTEPLFKVASKLSKSEFDNFGAYVEGRMPIPNMRVQNAVDAWNKNQNTMGDTAIKAGLHLVRDGKTIPFQKVVDNYWPRIPSEKLSKTTIVDRLVKNGMSRHEATRVAKQWENTGEIIIGSQHSRLEKIFQYRDDFDAAISHGRSMSKRIANHENLGPKDIAGFGDEGIAKLIEDTNDPNLAYKLAKRLAGRDEMPNERLIGGLNQARKWMSLTSLTNFTIPNVILGQSMNAYMGILSRHPLAAVKEVSKLIRSSYRDEIRASGALNSFSKTLAEELSGLDPFQIGVGEVINRSVAAAVGRSTVREAFKDYKSGTNTKAARYFLETLLARDPDTITSITPDLERFAAGRMAEISQGLNNPGNLPYGWSNPINSYGSVATQLMLIFKKVGFQTTKTIKDTMKANPAVAVPLWAGITQVAGELVGDVKSGITGKERPEGAARIADNWGNAFMLGLPWELATSAQYGPTAMIGSAVGPAFGKASELGYDIYKTGENLMNEENEDPFRQIRRFGLKNLPVPGRERLLAEEE